MKKILYSLLIILCVFKTSIYSQYTSIGTDFWVSWMPNIYPDPECQIFISSETGANGVVSIPGAGWTQNFSIPANGSTMINIPISSDCIISTPNAPINRGTHIISDNPISVYASNTAFATSDATLILPTNSLGDQYFIVSYKGLTGSPTVVSEFLILATENNTSIQIIPKVNLYGGYPANVPFNITLNRGEAYLVQALSSDEDLTGSSIKATNTGSCNNFVVFSGTVCANVPDCRYCDHLFEQMIPTKAWGKNYITTPLMTRNGDQFRIVAKDNGTLVSINGGSPITLNAGQYSEQYLNQATYITSNNPICVAQYSRGSECDNTTSDPFMIILSPIEQFINHIIFQAFNTPNISQFYMNVITKTTNTNLVTYDGSPLGGWNTVAANPEFSFYRTSIAQGTHILHSDSGLLAIVYGYGHDDSYGYLAGVSVKPIDINLDILVNNDTLPYIQFNDTICPSQNIGFFIENDSIITNISWNFGDGNTAVGNPVYHTYVTPGSHFATLYYNRLNSCVIDSIVVNINVENLNVNILASDTNICIGDSTVLTAISNISANYLWSNGLNSNIITVSPQQDATYYVTATSNTGCTDTSHINIFVGPVPTLNVSNTGPYCAGENIQLNASTSAPIINWYGPNNFYSDINNPLINNSDTTMLGYYYVIANNSGCIRKDSTYVIVYPLPIVNILADAGGVCSGNTNTLIAMGANTYLWSTGENSNSIIIQPSNSTIYTVTGTDSNGCSNIASLTIEVFQLPPLNAGPDREICLGDSAQLNGSGASIYSWSPPNTLNDNTIPNPIATPNATTTYYLTGYDVGGNIILNGNFENGNVGFTSDYNYSSNLWPENNYYITDNPHTYHSHFANCSDHTTNGNQMMVINGSGTPNTKVWCQTLNVLPNNWYTFSCWVTSVNVQSPAILQFYINGDTLGTTFNAPSDTCIWQYFQNMWYSNNTTTANICIVNQNTAFDGNDFAIDDISFISYCSNIDSAIVKVNPIPNVNISYIDTSICVGDSTILSANSDVPNTNFNWSNGSNNSTIFVSPQVTTTYMVTGNASNCLDFDTITVIVNENPFATYSTTPEYCDRKDGSIELHITNGTPPYTIQWSNGNNSSINNNLSSGNYSVTITDNNGCKYIADVEVDFVNGPLAQFTASPTYTTMENPIIYFYNYSINANYYLWDFDDLTFSNLFSPQHMYQNPGNYNVTLIVTDENNCKDTAEALITIKEISTFYVPNAITPDGDGENDIFTLFATNIDLNTFEMRIFDRWGEQLFYTQNINQGWDGTFNGQLVKQDSYVYVMKFVDLEKGELHKLIGKVLVIY